MSNNYSQDIPYTKQLDVQEYIDAFDIDNESINFTTLENYSDSEYVLNRNTLQKIKNNINVIQNRFDMDIIRNLNDKQESFQRWVEHLSKTATPYETGKFYRKGDVVTYNQSDEGAIFLCTRDVSSEPALGHLPAYCPLPYITYNGSASTGDNLSFSFAYNIDYESGQQGFAFTHTYTFGIPEHADYVDYDGEYTLYINIQDTELLNSLSFIGDKNLYSLINLNITYDYFSVKRYYPWLRIYPKGEAGLDAFKFDWRGEWNANSEYESEKSHEPGSIHPGSLVWYRILNNINFYFCIQDVSNSATSPDQDTTHWIKLFTKKLDGFIILDSMPNQAWFDDDTNPSVFGVKQSDGFTIKIIDRIHSESASSPQYLKLYTVANNVVDMIFGSNDNNLNTLINNLISNTNI